MARIVIKESDLTTPIIATSGSEVVYVPGFGTNESNYLNASTKVGKGTPTLCTTVSEFNAYFGSIPAVFVETQTYPDGFSSASKDGAGTMLAPKSVDPSYIYAKELINAGIPVLYERLNDFDETPSVSMFYQRLVGTNEYDPLLNLNNVNDFNIKYITTGGYPSFEFGYTLGATAVGGTTIEGGTPGIDVKDNPPSVVSNTFIDEVFVGEDNPPTEGEFAFIYSELQTSTVGEPVVSAESGMTNVTVDSTAFINSLNPTETTTYTFTAPTSGTSTTWTLDGEEIGSINDYGITFEGTPADGATIAITVTVGVKETWAQGNVEVDIAELGITYTGTPKLGDFITVIVAPANNTSIVSKMLFVASSRGDCVALIDHTNNKSRSLIAGNENSVYWAASNDDSKYRIVANGEFGAMFTPWYVPTYITSSKPSTNVLVNTLPVSEINWEPAAMPPSFGYLMSLADSVRNNPSWLSIAGVTRGVIPNFIQLNLATRLTNAIADSYQKDDKISINPITNIRPYGYTIWGNRTLKANNKAGGLTATSFLNIRNMVSDIKKRAYTAAISCLFEQNTDILWLNFKSSVEPILEQMTSGYGISAYKVIREQSNDPTKIIATIRIYPVYAVESFEITVELSNDTVNFAE